MTEIPVGGVLKIIEKGSSDPEAIRFHVPAEQGGCSQVTWGELLEHTRHTALWMAASEAGPAVRPGDKVAVFATTRVDWAWVCAAIEACRGVFVPVYFSNTAEQTHYVVDHSDAELLFTELALLPKVLERFEDYDKLRTIVVWDLPEGEAGDEALRVTVAGAAERRGRRLEPEPVRAKVIASAEVEELGAEVARREPDRLETMVTAIDPDDVAAIIYTSGTTGAPKGVVLTIANLAATTAAWYEVLEHAFPPPGERRDILWLPVSHMSGWGILGQGTLFEYETWLSDPWHLLGMLPEVRPTMLFSVPAYWEKMATLARLASDIPEEQYAELRRLTGGALHFLLSGGAGLKREVKDFFKAAGIHIIEGYGMTETAPNLTMNRLDDYDFDSVGKPVPGVSLRLADDGEILVRGANVFSGYYKMPDETAASFTEPDEHGHVWFKTGDLGCWRPGGFLAIIGRKKELIVTTGGKKIAPGAIEARFATSPYIEHIVLYGSEHKYVVALITPDERVVRDIAKHHGLDDTSYATLLEHPVIRGLFEAEVAAVNAELASYETIKRFLLHPGHLSVEAGHVTPSLKVRRRQVWADFGDQLESLYEEPR